MRDIDAEKITIEGASVSYGAVIVDGRVDTAATERRRAEIRAERQRLGGGSAPVDRVDLAGARHINDSLVQVGSAARAAGRARGRGSCRAITRTARSSSRRCRSRLLQT